MGLTADHETLVAALRQRGVDWLAPSDAVLGEAVGDQQLIASLAAHPDPRLRAALTGLFLLHSQLWVTVENASEVLDEAGRHELAARFMAAVYLQRYWRTRLTAHSDSFVELPDLFSTSLGLPPADEAFGKPGLYALAEWHKSRTVVPYNRLAEYNQVAEHVFNALKAKARTRESALAS